MIYYSTSEWLFRDIKIKSRAEFEEDFDDDNATYVENNDKVTIWIFRDIKIKSRAEFEEDFDGIKELIAAKTLFMVDDKISMFEEVRKSYFSLSKNHLKFYLFLFLRSNFKN